MNIPILMYHEIYKPEERLRLQGLTNPAYNLQLNTFERQIAWLAENKINTLTIEDLLSEKAVNVGQTVCLTFDDGWKGNYLHAHPVLLKQGFRATFFVAVGLIGRENYMTWDQLSRMQSSGMSIQSHALTHRPLTAMKEEDLLLELRESKNIIEEKLSARVSHLSLPHGQKEKKIWDRAKEIGYRSICTSDVGFYIPGSWGPWLKRISVGDGMSEDQFRLLTQGKRRALLKMIIIKRIKNLLRSAMGSTNFRNLYRRVYGIR
jgi:peptidoglycan/xylan/chitin deacetylase (PgdA/CDA1 family)